MDAGYISPRLEAVSLQTAHQDERQVWGRELDQLRRRRAGLTIHSLPQKGELAYYRYNSDRTDAAEEKPLFACWSSEIGDRPQPAVVLVSQPPLCS